jgi:hypothetical protein
VDEASSDSCLKIEAKHLDLEQEMNRIFQRGKSNVTRASHTNRRKLWLTPGIDKYPTQIPYLVAMERSDEPTSTVFQKFFFRETRGYSKLDGRFY